VERKTRGGRCSTTIIRGEVESHRGRAKMEGFAKIERERAYRKTRRRDKNQEARRDYN
jgi:hypothetical protein